MKFRAIGLKTHDPDSSEGKSKIGSLQDMFGYLGYVFQGQRTTVRDSSIDKLGDSLVSIFTSHMHSQKRENKQSKAFLLWRLNLRITGCVFQNRSRGWLAYFSEINDESLLHRLDNHVGRLIERFGVQVTPKKFVRAYFEMKHRRYETTYIPNFDRYSLDEMKSTLTSYFGYSTANLSVEEIQHEFARKINKQVKDLLEDLSDFS